MEFTKLSYTSKDIIRIAFKISPVATTIYFLFSIVNSIFPTFIMANITTYFIDTALLMSETSDFKSIIIKPLLYLIACMIFTKIFQEIPQFVELKLKCSIERNILPLIVKHQASIEYKWIENEEKQIIFAMLLDDIKDVFIDGLSAYYSILQGVIAVFSVLILIIIQNSWLAILILIFSIPIFRVSFLLGKKNYSAKIDAKKYERRYSYYSDEVLLSKEALEERMIFGYIDNITDNRYYKDFKKASNIQLRVLLKTRLSMKIMNVALIFICTVISFLFIQPLSNGLVSPGFFIGLITALFNLTEILGGNIQDSAKNIAETKEYMAELTTLLSLDRDNGAIVSPDDYSIEFKDVEFRNVSFKYPNADKYILKNISFKLENGKHYALVGSNGSGKSTIVKLLTGLYKNYEGEILINGLELRSYEPSKLKSLISVVFQDLAHYQISLKDNLQLGSAKAYSNHCYLEAIKKSGLSNLFSSLSNGLDTQLGRLKETARELSGGQWQKITFARSLLHSAPFKILDEPTAALDPIAEDKLYKEFDLLMKEKTTLFISHRLGSTKLANQIIVLEKGKIVEKGSFEELMDLNAYFYKMFQVQKEWYQ